MSTPERPRPDSTRLLTPPSGTPRLEIAIRVGDDVYALTPAGLSIGRDPGNNLTLATDRASRSHARIELDGAVPWITDLGSRNGTRVNGRRIAHTTPLANGDVVTIGGVELEVLNSELPEQRPPAPPEPEPERFSRAQTRPLDLERPCLSVGRDESNDIVLEDPNISRFHATIELARDGSVAYHDLSSSAGSYVEGARVERHRLAPGSEVRLGPYRLGFEGDSVIALDDRGHLHLNALDVAFKADGRTILQPTSFAVGPGEFVAIIGESGAGKTTLLKALAGVTRPSSGRVLVNGEPLAAHGTSIGYVPQVEAIHVRLTLREALTYAAQLRLPEDATASDVQRAVHDVADEIGLLEHLGTRVDRLSGGQRRRAGVAIELLSQPGLLFLDEPTTGLDPGFERRMMELLRGLADESRSVVIVTHATQSLGLADRVVVMARGGRLSFDGAPDAALSFFSAESFEQVYTRLDTRPSGEWQARFRGLRPRISRPHRAQVDQTTPAPATRRQSHRHQARVLTRRYLRVMSRDRRNLLILIGQVPLIALALIGLFDRDVFAATGEPSDAAQLLFLVVTTALWLGSIDAAREIIKERAVVARESAVGVRSGAYLRSKLTVLFGLVAVQTGLLTGLLFALRPLHADAGAYALVIAATVLTGCAAVAMGLVISALVRSQDQATSLVPLVLIPQLFFAGAIIPVVKMNAVVSAIASFVFARWAFALVGSAIDMNERIAADPIARRAGTYGTDFFGLAPAAGLAILVTFVVAFALATRALLRTRVAE